MFRPLVQRSARHSINVVYYHLVGASAPHYDAFYRGCDLARFVSDLERLQCDFDFASLPQVLARSRDQVSLESRPVIAVTFDDGLDLEATGAMAVLDRFGIKATMFVITSCVGNQHLMWRHALSAIQTLAPEASWRRAYEDLGFGPLAPDANLLEAANLWPMDLKDEWASALWSRCSLPPVADYLADRQPYFGWDGLKRWIAAGHTVGFHTHTHPYCSRLRSEDLDREIIGPAAALRQALGLSSLFLSYPFGSRLSPALETRLFEEGHFQALFGIRGASPVDASFQNLERAGIESTDLSWAVYAAHAFPFLR